MKLRLGVLAVLGVVGVILAIACGKPAREKPVPQKPQAPQMSASEMKHQEALSQVSSDLPAKDVASRCEQLLWDKTPPETQDLCRRALFSAASAAMESADVDDAQHLAELLVTLSPGDPSAEALATRTSAARDAIVRLRDCDKLTSHFKASLIGAFDIRFIVRGSNCDVLHVDTLNLYKEMMEALAWGSVIYGKVLPGGVNRWALERGFISVGYTSRVDSSFLSAGDTKLTARRLKALPLCSREMALKVEKAAAPGAGLSEAEKYEHLSWATATPGTKVYDGGFHHVVTIVAQDQPNGLIRVRYVKDGTIEPKLLDALAPYWYVRKTGSE